MGYYDISDILAEEQTIPVLFHSTSKGIGFINPGGSMNDLIPAQSVVNIPFWMANCLSPIVVDTVINEQGEDQMVTIPIIEIHLPMMYSTKSLSILLADPVNSNIRLASPYYFEIGKKLILSSQEDERTISELAHSLITSIVNRFTVILDKSQNARGEDVSIYVQRLTESERLNFDEGYRLSNEYLRWKRREFDRLGPSRWAGR